MKKYLKTFIVLLCVLCRAQNNFIVYDKTIDDTGGFDKIRERSVLVFDHENSVFFSYKGELHNINDFLNNEEKIRSSQIIKNSFNEKKYQIKDNSFTRETVFATDDYQNFSWKVVPNEEITILGYKCSKAIGKFRGREYEVWFAKDLPAGVGPWKFRGLPGSILKASDKDHLFIFEASKIVLNFPLKQNLSTKLTFEFPNKTSGYLSFQQYIGKENEYLRDIAEKVKANRPVGTTVTSSSKYRDYKLEKNFEWEDSKKP